MASTIKLCQYCNKIGPHPAAHIWPQGLNGVEKGTPLETISLGARHLPGRSWTGIYDSDLWCQTCEDDSHELDNYAVLSLRDIDAHLRLCVDQNGFPLVDPSGAPLAWTAEGIDSLRLHLFVLSVIWRASASKRKEFSSFKLGPYQDRIRTILRFRDIEGIKQFPFLLRREQESDMRSGFETPALTRWCGSRTITIHAGGYEFIVKMDKKGVDWAEAANRPGRPVVVLPFRLLRTRWGRDLAKAVQRSMRNENR